MYPHSPVYFPLTRDPRLPRFVRYERTHPLWNRGNAYVYGWDITPNAQKEFLMFSKERLVSGRFEDELIAGGEMQLKPDEAIFVRRIGETDPHQDVLQAIFTDDKLLDTISPHFREKLMELRDEMLGPEHLRTPEAPERQPDGTYSGGVHFERSHHRATPAVEKTRCYQYQGLSTENPRNASSVNVNSKTPSDEDRNLKTRMLKNFISAALATVRLAPPAFHIAAKTRAELVGAPRIGNDDNIYFTQVQANISKCYRRDEEAKLEQLGDFGLKHIDKRDHEDKLTVAGAFSHMPSDYHPGLFILFELGVFVRLDTGHHLCFSGLRYHGGTPPTAPEGQEPVYWACRFLHIAYPSGAFTDMRGRQALGPIPGDEILYIPPEMLEHRIPNLEEYPLHAQRSSYIQDGVDIMSPQAHMTFVSRLLLRLCQHEMAAMPYGAHINPDTFFSSIEFQDVDGTRLTVPPWRFAERIADLSAEQEQEFRTAWDIVDQHTLRTRVFIPHVAKHAAKHVADDTFAKLKAARTGSFAAQFARQPRKEISQNTKGTKRKHAMGHGSSQKRLKKAAGYISDNASDIDNEAATGETGVSDEDTAVNNGVDMQESEDNGQSQGDGMEGTAGRPSPFESALCLEELEQIDSDISRESLRAGTPKSTDWTKPGQVGRTYELSTLLSNISHDPLENKTIQGTIKMWHTVAQTKKGDVRNSFYTRVSRQHVMLANVAAWNWVRRICAQEVISIVVNNETGEKAWTRKLVTRIRTFLETHTAPELSLDRTDYDPFATMSSCMVTVKPPHSGGRHPTLPTPEEVVEQMIKAMVYVMMRWLDFPDDRSLVNFQASFVEILLSITGSADILLLDATWKAFSCPKSRLFNNRRLKAITPKRLQHLRDILGLHPISVDSSPETQLLAHIASLHIPYGAWSPTTRTDILHSAVSKFVHFLRTLDPILDEPVIMPTDSPLFRRVKSNLDFFLPFREHAPSRIRVQSNDGPFEENYIRRRSGLFSALIYRGVTYGAPAELDAHNNKFDRPADWTIYFEGLTDESLPENGRATTSYFCNPRAYGTPNIHRVPQNAEKYWEGTSDWEDFIADGMPTFIETQKYILREDCQGRKVFPNVGPLTGYLICADLCYAGVIQPPTLEEMGHIIQDINCGSYAQLMVLEVFDARASREENAHSFIRFHEAVRSELTEEEKTRWRFTPFTMEHALCKKGRLLL